MKNLLLYAVLIATAVIFTILTWGVAELESENNRLSVQLAHAHVPILRDTIHDSINVVTQTVINVAPKNMKEALAKQAQTIKELRLRIRQIEAEQTTAVTISDSVPAGHSPKDSSYHYHDEWADITLSLRDSSFRYSVRDSMEAYVYREYKHRFLWWRWGTKGYRLKMVNYNPHARVTYNKYVRTTADR